MSQFSFNFELDGDDVEEPFNVVGEEQSQAASDVGGSGEPFTEVPLSQMLDRLPTVITFSPLSVPLSSGRRLTLYRRDLFDARFQLISEDNDDRSERSKVLDFIDNPSDLVPGVYEGGLKTWECSLDLVDYLEGLQDPELRDVRGKRILELGCGTAIPSLYLLQNMFSSDNATRGVETNIHLQDFNSSVLELVTLPNVLLTWYLSSASTSYRSCEVQDNDAHGEPVRSTTEVSITTGLIEAFLITLRTLNITLRFFAGSWEHLDVRRCGGPYHVVLTSETIYRRESIPSLISAMQSACCGLDSHQRQHQRLMEQNLGTGLDSLTENWPSITAAPSLHDHKYLCLVAAKVIYFGVGGGVAEFSHFVGEANDDDHDRKGVVETVWERHVGVGRRVLRIQWLNSGL